MFNQLVNPGGEISPDSILVHGIVPAMVAKAPSGPEAWGAFLRYLGNDILVAHNASFDMAFFNRLMRMHHGFPLQNLVIDTLPMCRRLLLPNLFQPFQRQPRIIGRTAINSQVQKSLEEIAQNLGIKVYQRHSAVGDALATAMIFQRSLSILKRLGQGQLNDLVRAGTI